MLSLLLLGFFIGMRHALEADHIAAVASLATNTTSVKTAIRQGAVWGVGHTVALFLFSTIVILSDSIIPENYVSALELAVGIMLVFLGADVIRRLARDRVHFHSHQHDDRVPHFHAHKHTGNQPHSVCAHKHEHSSALSPRALYIGLMHGMAGSAALIILTLQSVESVATGLLYILMFGIGSIVGMAVLSVIIAIPLHRSAKGLTWLNNGFQTVIGIATIAIGSMLIVDFGIG